MAKRPRSRAGGVRRLVPWLLALPVLIWVYPPLFVRQTPRLGAFPFFVWYQIAAALATGALIGVVFLLRERGDE
jgi:hypothetical protein